MYVADVCYVYILQSPGQFLKKIFSRYDLKFCNLHNYSPILKWDVQNCCGGSTPFAQVWVLAWILGRQLPTQPTLLCHPPLILSNPNTWYVFCIKFFYIFCSSFKYWQWNFPIWLLVCSSALFVRGGQTLWLWTPI